MEEEHILPDEDLSPEDLTTRKKGQALAAHMEHLYQTDEGFRRWLDEGYEQVEAGQVVEIDMEPLLIQKIEKLEQERNALLEIIKTVFSIPEVSDVRKCRLCSAPVVHMEHLKLDEALAIEKKVRTLLKQDGPRYDPDDYPGV